MATIRYPSFMKNRGPGYWLNPSNIWASRRAMRSDKSTEWRNAFTKDRPPPYSRSVPVSRLVGREDSGGFKCLILGDTGEGDTSQYSLLPVIKALDPDFMIINGDIAYPAGRSKDFEAGFFRPYTGLGIPIWAVPGNHEYYSKDRGRECFQIFCTRRWASRWATAGLRLVEQPGTYWELHSEAAKLVILGVDTGMKADLDGKHQLPDHRQHLWLRHRLRNADLKGLNAVVLFHIPALSREKHVKKTQLTALHQMIARHPCVKLVVCGHDHNYQRYAPDTVGDYLRREHNAALPTDEGPPFMVVGAGGASLSKTDWHGGYTAAERRPTEAQWRDYANGAVRFAQSFGAGKWIVAAIVSALVEEARIDKDPAKHLCALELEFDGDDVRATPILLEDLEAICDPGADFNVTDPGAPPFRPNWRARLTTDVTLTL